MVHAHDEALRAPRTHVGARKTQQFLLRSTEKTAAGSGSKKASKLIRFLGNFPDCREALHAQNLIRTDSLMVVNDRIAGIGAALVWILPETRGRLIRR